MKIKVQKPKPLNLEFQWQKEFQLVRITIYIILVFMCVTLYVAYSVSEEKIKIQDEQIISLRQSLTETMIWLHDTEEKLDKMKSEFEIINRGHTIYDNKYGKMYHHIPLGVDYEH